MVRPPSLPPIDEAGSYTESVYPDDSEYESRANLTAVSCDCEQANEVTSSLTTYTYNLDYFSCYYSN